MLLLQIIVLSCKKSKPNYLIKKEGQEYFIKGVGGEATYNEWVKMKKK